jgi:glycosyltransferase involved in cell wall biosynthesis
MKNKILFIGRFAPPIHGAAKVNELYFNSSLINEKYKLKKVRINRYDSLKEIGSFSFKKFIGVFSVFFELLYQLMFFRPKLVYFEIAPTGFAFYRDSIYVLLCKIFRRKILFHFHAKGLDRYLTDHGGTRYYRFVFKNTRAILLSPCLYSDIKEIFPREKVLILPNGVINELTDKEFRKILIERKNNKIPKLIFLSNMIESKGVLDTLKICNQLNKRNISFDCVFVGAWQDKDLESTWKVQVKKYGLEKKCKHLGPKYGNEKKKILEGVDYLIFPTKYEKECFPLVILEAFMFGIPVLSYDNGAVKEIISKPFLGFVSKQGKWEDLWKELDKRLKNPEKGTEIRKHFEKNYSMEIAEKNLVKIFSEELNEKRE